MHLDLYMLLGVKGGGGSDGPRVSGGGRTPPIPVRPDVDALMRRVVDVLSSWEERVRLIVGLSGADTELSRRRRDEVAMTTACRTLAAHVDVLLALEAEPMMRDLDVAQHERLPEDATGVVHPAAGWISYFTSLGGGDAATEIFSLHAACRSKLGRTPKHVLLRSRCWDCDAAGKLVRHDGAAGLDDHVSCQACRTEYVGDRLARLMADEERLEREIAMGGKKAS